MFYMLGVKEVIQDIKKIIKIVKSLNMDGHPSGRCLLPVVGSKQSGLVVVPLENSSLIFHSFVLKGGFPLPLSCLLKSDAVLKIDSEGKRHFLFRCGL